MPSSEVVNGTCGYSLGVERAEVKTAPGLIFIVAANPEALCDVKVYTTRQGPNGTRVVRISWVDRLKIDAANAVISFEIGLVSFKPTESVNRAAGDGVFTFDEGSSGLRHAQIAAHQGYSQAVQTRRKSEGIPFGPEGISRHAAIAVRDAVLIITVAEVEF